MGVKKVYKSTTGIQYGFVIPITRVGKTISTSISLGSDLTVEVLFPDIQEAIENTTYFRNKQIEVEYEKPLTEVDNVKLETAKKAEEDKLKAIKEHNALQELSYTDGADKKSGNDETVVSNLLSHNHEEKDENGSIESTIGKRCVGNEDPITDYPDVTNINEAVEILRGQPYNVHHMKVRTPAAIQEQAILNKVTFSNWTEA